VVLEVECGVVGGAEDDVSGEGVEHGRLYTTTEDLLRVAGVLGTGERGRYLLAATFATSTAYTRPGRSSCGPRSCARAKMRSLQLIPAPASSTSSTAAAARANRTCAMPSATAW
jgi:fructose-bisphosphate aldolase, class II